MRFAPSARWRDAPTYVTRFISLIGWNNITDRIDQLEALTRQSPIAGHHLSELAITERTLVDLHRQIRSRGRLKTDRPAEVHAILSFATMIVEIERRLSSAGSDQLRGRLRDALRSERGFEPLRHEMIAASHMLRDGWDITLVDLEGLENFDILATDGEIELELECKTASVDMGRKLHRRDIYRLLDACHDAFSVAAVNPEATILIELTVADRLPTRDADFNAIAAHLNHIAQHEPEGEYEGEEYRIRKRLLDVPGNSMRRPESLRETLPDEFPNPDFHAGIFGIGDSTALLVVRSDKPDQKLAYLYKQLKRAHEQFSGWRASSLWVNVEDVEPEAWRHLKDQSGLQHFTSRYLGSPSRDNVCFVAYSSLAEYIERDDETQERGLLLHYDNTECRFHNDRFSRIFQND